MTNNTVRSLVSGVDFLKPRIVKRRAWKTLNIISTLAVVFNAGLVGTLILPQVAQACTGTITGVKFEDLNGNGKQDTGEPLLPGWTIKLFLQQSNGSWSLSQTTTTIASGPHMGEYTFNITGPATYKVEEVQQAGWIQMTPTPPTINLTAANTGFSWTINFGNARVGNLTVSKKVDVNGSGSFVNDNPSSYGFKWGLDAGTADKAMGSTASNVFIGNHTVNENAISGYHFVGWYPTGSTQYSCTNIPQGNASLPAIVSVAQGDNGITLCNVKEQKGTIELKKIWSGTPGQTTLNIGTTAGASNVDSQLTGAAGASPLTTGANTVTAGTYYVSEAGSLTNYTSSLDCTDNGSPITPGPNNSVQVTTDHTVVCTFTNTRNTGTIELKKIWVGTPGQTTLNIGTSANSFDIANQATGINGAAPLTTGTKTVPTGTYYVSETGGLANYSASLACTDNGTPVTPTNNSVTVSAGHAVICTFTNTRDTGNLIIHKNVVAPDGVTNVTDTHGFTVNVSGNGSGTIAEGTDASFNLPTGTYTVTENLDANYSFVKFSADANSIPTDGAQVTVTKGTTTELTVTNAQKYGTISGHKFEDLNGNGIWDNGEPALQGWTMTLSNGATATTNAAGVYTFSNVVPGTYSVTEEDRTGWTHTTTNPLTGIVIGSNGTSTNNNFGNFQNISITGCKVIDQDGSLDSTKDQTPKAGWNITLSKNGHSVDTQATGENGCATWSNLGPGSYSVSEATVAGYSALGATSHDFGTVTCGTDPNYTYTFINTQNASIKAVKLMDADGNASTTGDQTPKAGWTVQLWQGASQIGGNQVTGADGSYTFANLVPGTYTVKEIVPAGYTALTSTSNVVHLASGAQDVETFINFQNVNITACKYVDTNGDGNITEDPLYTAEGGWPMTLALGDGKTTQNTVRGCTTFSNLAPGAYTVSEGSKTGWVQTYPTDPSTYMVNATSGQNQTMNFGNFQLGKILGYKYSTNEQKLNGWTICLDSSDNCVVTGSGNWPTGYYEFDNVSAGQHTVKETQVYGWYAVSPALLTGNVVTMTSGASVEADFVNGQNSFTVGIEKTGPVTTNAGDSITYTLNWSVSGNTPVNTVLTDPLPANTTFVSASNGGTSDGTTVTWNLGTKNPAANGSVTLTVKANSPLDSGTVITNTGKICGTGELPLNADHREGLTTKCATSTVTTTVSAKASLGLTKTADLVTVNGNQNITYTITWSVAGNSQTTNVTVTDPIPATTTYVSMNCGSTTGMCTMSTTGTPVTSATWLLGTRNPGETGTLTYVVKTAISVPNGSIIPNTAKIAADGIDPVFATANVTAATAPQLQITKTANATIVNPGDPITYTVLVKNIGTDTAINAVMSDTLPAGFTWVSENPAATTIVGQTGTWNLGNMAVGDTKTIAYTVNVAPGTTAGTYNNIAAAKADNAPKVSTQVPVQTRVPQVLGETTTPTLGITKTVSKTTANPGDVLTYTVIIKNTGSGSAINVVLNDTLPTGFTFDGTTLTTKSWSLGDLAAGASNTVTYKVNVGSSVPAGSYDNLAVAKADNHSSIHASVSVTVKRGRVLGETLPTTGAGILDYGIAAAGAGLIILGFVLARRKQGSDLA